MPDFHPDFGDFVQEDVGNDNDPVDERREQLFAIVRSLPTPFERKLAAKAAVIKLREAANG